MCTAQEMLTLILLGQLSRLQRLLGMYCMLCTELFFISALPPEWMMKSCQVVHISQCQMSHFKSSELRKGFHSYQVENEEQWKKRNRNTYDISFIIGVTRNFHVVVMQTMAKKFIKKCAAPAKLFSSFANKAYWFFAVLVACCCITRSHLLFE